MADPTTEQKIVVILLGIIKLLALSVEQMEEVIPKPKFLDQETERARWRFEVGSPLILQVLMCVRVSSALRACAILLGSGHTTEMGVLFRTINDFLSDITFADEVIEKGIDKVTTTQRDWVESYFIDEKRTTQEMVRDSVEPARRCGFSGRRQKVQASEARIFGGEDPHHVKKLVKTIDDAWSGVVHGNYFSVMEMYGGDTMEGARFDTEGLPSRFSQYRHHLGLYVHNALNQFSKVAYNLGLLELAAALREARRTFEKSPAYTAQ